MRIKAIIEVEYTIDPKFITKNVDCLGQERRLFEEIGVNICPFTYLPGSLSTSVKVEEVK